jgi:hypothetical protein
MKKLCRADGLPRGKGAALVHVAVAPVKPALASIPSALAYLGDPSRAKFYADLLPQLDIVKFGTRTFVTISSLDRLIAANAQPAATRLGALTAQGSNKAANTKSRSDTAESGGIQVRGRPQRGRASLRGQNGRDVVG